MQVTDRPSPNAPSLTQAIIVQMVYCLEIQRYQNVINQGGHPIALVSMGTTLREKSLHRMKSFLRMTRELRDQSV